MKLFITGIGSGLGKALVDEALKRGYRVYAISRHMPKEFEERIKFIRCDLQEIEKIYPCVHRLLKGIDSLDLVVLNAGILGKFGDIHNIPLYEIQSVMNINVWANKVIMDALIDLKIPIKQVVGISSGAAVNCNRGWNAYSISKAALNCLLKLYAREMESTHITALAPGLVLTPMLEEVMEQDESKYPSIKRIKESPKRTPEEAAKLLFETFPKLLQFESGSFIDVRKI